MQGIQGLKGDVGLQGIQGLKGDIGVNAFSLLRSDFTQPDPSTFVTITVVNSDWMTVGQVLYINKGGYYQVSLIQNTSVQLINLSYNGNAIPGTIIPSGQKVVPAGIQGPKGDNVTGSGYISAFDVTIQPTVKASFWQNVSFGKVQYMDNWAISKSIDFYCKMSGLYTITIAAKVKSEKDNTAAMLRVIINGTEVQGSQVHESIPNASYAVNLMSKSMIRLKIGDILNVQFAANDGSISLAPMDFGPAISSSATSAELIVVKIG